MVGIREPRAAFAVALGFVGILAFAGGCATKAYVRDRVGELGSRLDAEDAGLRRDAAAALARADEAGNMIASTRALALGDVNYRQVDELTVTFAFDSAELSPAAQGVLADAVDAVAANPRALVDILGHADTIGPAAYNDELSRRRAAAVLRYLVLHGPGPVSRYAVVGLGEASPVLVASGEDRAASRRVVLSFLERTEPGAGSELEAGEPVISQADADGEGARY